MAGAFLGFVDFVGYPVGRGVYKPRGGTWAAGRHVGRYYAQFVAQMLAQDRSVLDGARQRREMTTLARRLALRRIEEELETEHQRRVTEGAMYATLLTEL